MSDKVLALQGQKRKKNGWVESRRNKKKENH